MTQSWTSSHCVLWTGMTLSVYMWVVLHFMAILYMYEVEARQSTFVRGQTIQLSDKRVPSLFLKLDQTDEFGRCFHTGTVLLFSLVTTVDAPPIKFVSEG
jgi:hypothetical protein